MNATTRNILSLARRVLDARAYAEYEAYKSAVRDPQASEVYRRTYNAIVDIRGRLTEKDIIDAAKGTWPEATQKLF